MSIATVLGFDVTHANVAVAFSAFGNSRQAALYMTGSSDIVATPADINHFHAPILIDQSPVLTALDETADVLDYEARAANDAILVTWCRIALANFKANKRPGQRSPAVYASRNNISHIINVLKAGGITSGIGLYIADWNNNEASATLEVANASGPFPVIARQYRNAGPYDLDVFSLIWLNNVSGKPKPKPAFPVPVNMQSANVITIGWQQVTGATGGYHYMIRETVTGHVVANGSTNDVKQSVMLPSGTAYQWRVAVHATDAEQASRWSDWIAVH